MNETPFIWHLLAIAVIAFAYKRFLVFTRDVPDEYLNEQSIIDSIRNPNESPIHKSTKLDYSMGLRVGLGIRYDSYKLRNGNLYDIWALAMENAKKRPANSIIIEKSPLKLSVLNGLAAQIRVSLAKLAEKENIDEIRVHADTLLADPHAWAVIVACFTSQTTVHIHDASSTPHAYSLELKCTNGGLTLHRGAEVVWNAKNLTDTDSKDTAFENEYTYEKDRGIALRVSQRINHKATACTDFTQSNLVSAVASCIKHFPPSHQFNTTDLLAVVLDKSTIDGLVNGIVKVLAGFVTGSDLIVASDLATCLAHSPTILSAHTEVVKTIARPPKGIDKIFTLHRLFSLSCNRISNLVANKPYPRLRLVIAHRSINSHETSPEWRRFFAALVCHVIEEIGYYNAAGPVLVTDFYDFRKFAVDLSKQRRTHGAVAQSNEAKLVNFDGKSNGTLAVRGYNMGKAKTAMEGVGESLVLPDEDGFYKLPVSSRWGLDGCLYVMQK